MAIALLEEAELRRIIREELESILRELRLGSTAESYPPILTAKEAAEVARVSMSKVYEFARRPGFPVVKEGRILRIPRDAYLAWLEQQKEA